MKNKTRFAALLLAVLMTITVFASAVLAEEENPSAESSSAEETSTESSAAEETSGSDETSSDETSSDETSGDETSGDETSGDETSGDETSGDESSSEPEPDPNAYTVNVSVNGGAEVYFNGEKFEGSVYTASADGNSVLSIKVAPKTDSELVSVYWGNTKEPVINGESSFNIVPEAGKSYDLTVTAKAVPKKVSVSVETKGVLEHKLYVNGAEFGTAVSDIFTGDKVSVYFEIPEDFDVAKASLTLNGVSQSITSNTFEFTVTADTKIVMLYGVVPVKFVLVGPGMFNVSDIGEIRNNGSATVERTFYLVKDGQYNFRATPALNYELVGIVEITEPNRVYEDGVYYFRPSGPTTITARFKLSGGTAPDPTPAYTIQVNAGTGGTVTAGGQTIIGGTGTKIVLLEGESLNFTITPDDGYVIDVFRVGGAAVTLDGNTYTLSNVTSSMTVSALFKSEKPPVVTVGITADDIVWDVDRIIVDVSGGKSIMRDVFDKIASLEPAENKFIEFRSEGGTFYIPYGKAFSGSFESATLSIGELTSGALHESIKNAVASASEAEIIYKAFTFNTGIELPEGTMVSFELGEEFANSPAVMLLYDSANAKFFTKENAANAIMVGAGGASGKYFYDNEGVVICSKDIPGEFVIEASTVNNGGSITPNGATRVSLNSDCSFLITAFEGFTIKQILVDDQPLADVEGFNKYVHIFEKVGANHTIKVEFVANGETSDNSTDSDGNGTLIVVIIVIVVAIAGAAALFIVKWRQERF